MGKGELCRDGRYMAWLWLGMSEEAFLGKEEETPGEDMSNADDGGPKKGPVAYDGAMPCVDDGCIVSPGAVKGTYEWSCRRPCGRAKRWHAMVDCSGRKRINVRWR